MHKIFSLMIETLPDSTMAILTVFGIYMCLPERAKAIEDCPCARRIMIGICIVLGGAGIIANHYQKMESDAKIDNLLFAQGNQATKFDIKAMQKMAKTTQSVLAKITKEVPLSKISEKQLEEITKGMRRFNGIRVLVHSINPIRESEDFADDLCVALKNAGVDAICDHLMGVVVPHGISFHFDPTDKTQVEILFAIGNIFVRTGIVKKSMEAQKESRSVFAIMISS